MALFLLFIENDLWLRGSKSAHELGPAQLLLQIDVILVKIFNIYSMNVLVHVKIEQPFLLLAAVVSSASLDVGVMLFLVPDLRLPIVLLLVSRVGSVGASLDGPGVRHQLLGVVELGLQFARNDSVLAWCCLVLIQIGDIELEYSALVADNPLHFTVCRCVIEVAVCLLLSSFALASPGCGLVSLESIDHVLLSTSCAVTNKHIGRVHVSVVDLDRLSLVLMTARAFGVVDELEVHSDSILQFIDLLLLLLGEILLVIRDKV